MLLAALLAAVPVYATLATDRAYVDAYCTAAAPACNGHDRDAYCDHSDAFWDAVFTCSDITFDITEHIYDGVGDVPTQIGTLTNLEFLNIARPLSGGPFHVPTQIGLLTHLTALDLNGHASSLLAPVPTQLGRLTLIGSLRIHDMSFDASALLPSQLAHLSNIERFEFVRCYYSGGGFPGTAIGAGWRSTITTIIIDSATGLHDFLIPVLGNAPNLVQYNVVDSEGTLLFDDPNLFQSPQLASFVVSNNQFLSGTITGSFYSAPALQTVAITSADDPQLHFTLDERIASLGDTIESLFLRNAPGIVGTVPSEIGLLSNVVFLHLFATGLTGTLPDAGWDTLTSLENVQIGGLAVPSNGDCSTPIPTFTGSVPASLVTLITQTQYESPLIEFDIVGTCLSGTIPGGDASATADSLNTLQIRDTLLTDPLPQWMLDYMVELDSSLCDLTQNRFCFKPKPLSLDDVTCNFTLDGAIDDCGVCEGDNSACQDCDGNEYGSSQLDLCGVCDGNDECVDCNGIPFGTSVTDTCGVCGGNDDCIDCSGVMSGTLVYDACGDCGGNGTQCLDCFGVVYGTAIEDACGVCGGNDQTCLDCNGDEDGTKIIDACGDCVDVTAVDYQPTCYDCAGVANGTAQRDLCGNCPISPHCDVSGVVLAEALHNMWDWGWWAALGIFGAASLTGVAGYFVGSRRRGGAITRV